MKKMQTLFEKDPANLGRVIDVVRPTCAWALNPEISATVKFDGTSCAIIDGRLFKRFDAKINKKTGKYKRAIPTGAISCQEPDFHTGHHPHWVPCDRAKSADKFHFEAFDAQEFWEDGTYELCGPKVQSNKHKLDRHQLIKHGSQTVTIADRTFQGFRTFLSTFEGEGVVFHHPDGMMCKLRKKDFGLEW